MAILRHVSKLLKHDEILVSPGYPIPYFEDKLHMSDIQNKIIEINGEMVGEKIVRARNDFEYFGLIDDEATDVSTHEQISASARFVECTGRKGAS